jgi:hypothetical protein
MKPFKFHLLVISGISLFFTNSALSQLSVNSSGGDASGTGGTVAYSIGQIEYTAHSNASGSIDQGVQHAYEVFTLATNETEMNISASAFPNPTSDLITIKLSNIDIMDLTYHMLDMQGKVISNGLITEPETQLDMSSLPAATYFVSIMTKENKKLETFKVIKK